MSGIFERSFAERKEWKLDQGLLDALLATIPEDAAVIDLGAGIGRYVQAFRDAGRLTTYGVDGIDGIEELSEGLVLEQDLTCSHITGYDWAFCIEVGEHIPSELCPVFIRVVAEAATFGLIVSWARIGQRGRDHVSCHSPEWVACEFGKHDWTIDEEQTEQARKIAGKGWNKKLLVFRR